MAIAGTYADLTQLKAHLGISDTADDTALLTTLEDISREIDRHCGRWFYCRTQTRYLTARHPDRLLLPADLLSVTTLKTLTANSGGTRTYGDVWAATDYDLDPDGEYPTWRVLVNGGGSYSFPLDRRGVEIAGLWGHGDGESATPYQASGATVTVATTTGTSVTASSGAAFAAGQTILAGTEQMYIQSISTNTLTVRRGVNGTTAAVQAGAAASIYQYPGEVRRACLTQAKLGHDARNSSSSVDGGGANPSAGISLHPWVRQLLDPYRRISVG